MPELFDKRRRLATYRGLSFIHSTTLDGPILEEWLGDYLWCFYSISASAEDGRLGEMARGMGVEIARRSYARPYPAASPLTPDEVAYIVSVVDAANRLGVPNDGLSRHIAPHVGRFTARDYLGFEPAEEPPPGDIPCDCDGCGATSARGRSRCGKCGLQLTYRSRYDIWCTALVVTYTGDSFGAPLGAGYREVLAWLPAMRPYCGREAGSLEFHSTLYAVTHVVYTLTDYHQARLCPRSLPQEFEFLRSQMDYALAEEDPDMVGELLDSVRAFGVPDSDPAVRRGLDYLLSTQNPDGSWGNVDDPSIYNRYHATWAAVDGLRDYRRAREIGCADVQRRLSRPARRCAVRV